LQKWIL